MTVSQPKDETRFTIHNGLVFLDVMTATGNGVRVGLPPPDARRWANCLVALADAAESGVPVGTVDEPEETQAEKDRAERQAVVSDVIAKHVAAHRKEASPPLPIGISISDLFDALEAERMARAERIDPAERAEIQKFLEENAEAFKEGGSDDIAVARAILRRRKEKDRAKAVQDAVIAALEVLASPEGVPPSQGAA